VVRAVFAALVLPRRVREYRLARRKEKARSALLEALHEYFSGRYGRAEKAAAVSLEAGEQPVLSAVLAARAAHQLRAHERRDRYLAAAASAPDEQLARLVTEAELLLDDRRHQEALDLLKQLPRRHSAALRLELKAQQQLRNWEQVLALTEELRRRNAFDTGQAEQIRRHALAESLKRKLLDSHALEDAWNRMAAADRSDRRVAAAAAQCFIALGGSEQAHRIIEQALEAEWDGELVRLYAESGAGNAVARIERAETWLRSHPRDAALLLTLGRLCAEQALWGKAQSYLDASIAIEPTHTAHLAAARLQETLGNAEAARRHYREALDLALAQLHEVTGGRRRTPL
jgi:HemY protein